MLSNSKSESFAKKKRDRFVISKKEFTNKFFQQKKI